MKWSMRFMRFLLCFFWFASLAFSVCLAVRSGGLQDELQNEEIQDYYERWLKTDVVYIIAPEERDVFESLSSPEEKEQFIEQFWARRDPDPRTAYNEFKTEHYRRIAYANEYFGSGLQGWQTDRGRIYIIHGPPAEIEAYPAGGSYTRPFYEGGGRTATFPFEIWRYQRISDVGMDVELEFVDPSMSGEYHLATSPEEKDALLHIPGQGETLGERLGLTERKDRAYMSMTALNTSADPMMLRRAKDDPFQRYETYFKVMKPPKVEYRDLKQYVDVEISYDSIPIEMAPAYFSFSELEFLVPVTVQFDNDSVTFGEEDGFYVARLSIYGVVTSLTNRVVQEFEDDVILSYAPDRLAEGLQRKSLYQKILLVPNTMRHRVDLVIKDMNSENVGVSRKVLAPPRFGDSELGMSSLVISDMVQVLDEVPDQNQMFVLGDVKVRPRMDKRFAQGEQLGVYLQLYNVALDQTTLDPSLQIRYRILRNGRVIRESIDSGGASIQFFSSERIVLIKRLHLQGFQTGEYSIEVAVTDRISDRDASVTDQFEIIGSVSEIRK
jgi:GWxTD domain-containing protein